MINAIEIINQMGGFNKLSIMINARCFVKDENSLTFKFSGSKLFNCLKIKLNESDLYDLTFYKLGKMNIKKIEEYKNIYAENLISIFENKTNLLLSF